MDPISWPPGGHFGFCWWFYVPIEGVLALKKNIKQKLTRALNNLGLDTIADPVGHFGPPVGHFELSR